MARAGQRCRRNREDAGTHGHVAVVVDGGRAEDEAGHVRGDLLPAVVLDDPALRDAPLVRGVPGAALGGDEEVRVGDAGGANLERLARELVLGVDLAHTGQTGGACVRGWERSNAPSAHAARSGARGENGGRVPTTYLAVITPSWGLGIACRNRRVVAHLLRDVAVLLIEAHVFERLALGGNARAVRGPAPGNRCEGEAHPPASD